MGIASGGDLDNAGGVEGSDGTRIGNVGDRLKVDSAPTFIPQTNVIYAIDHLQNSGSQLMPVNGSVTPVNFDFSPGSGETWYLESLILFLLDSGTTSQNNFGAISGNLAKGLQILIRSGGVEYTVANIKDNTDIIKVFPHGPIIPPTSGFIEMSDAYKGCLEFKNPIRIANATSDYVRVKVRDNLTAIDQLEVMYKAWRAIS